MGHGNRSKWQDGRRAWARLNHWYLGHDDPVPDETPDPASVRTIVAHSLSDVALVRHLLDEVEMRIVRWARGRGVSWTEIGTPLGISRQSAWEKWRDLDPIDDARASGSRS
ncbi:hypothetical protein GCM10027053_03680 [Intrasporangium mesophilum]